MCKPVTVKLGQFLLLVVALLLLGAAVGISGVGFYWNIYRFVALSAPVEIAGLLALISVMVWKSWDDWAARTGRKPFDN